MPKRSSPSSIRSSFDESRTGPRRPGGRRPRLPSSCSGAAASSTARTAVAFWDDTWLEKDLALTLSSTNQSSRSTKAFSGARSRFPIQTTPPGCWEGPGAAVRGTLRPHAWSVDSRQNDQATFARARRDKPSVSPTPPHSDGVPLDGKRVQNALRIVCGIDRIERCENRIDFACYGPLALALGI